MAKRGRSPGFMMTDEHRSKIGNSKILNNLIEHIEGKRDMTSTQVTAGLGLLKKVMPDMQAIDFDGKMEHEVSSIEKLMEIINGTSRSK